MNIRLSAVGKRFNSEWIFRNLNYVFESGEKYAITGPNGSGKSTLLQVIGGYIQHNQGDIVYEYDRQTITSENIFKSVSIAAPYLEVIEEMTLKEFLNFHKQMKGLITGKTVAEIAASISLKSALNKQIRYFSSGMKQRVKLAQAIFSNTPVLLLDEPLTNLDAEGAGTYNLLMDRYTEGRTVIISSNDEREFHFCRRRINMTDYKENFNS